MCTALRFILCQTWDTLSLHAVSMLMVKSLHGNGTPCSAYCSCTVCHCKPKQRTAINTCSPQVGVQASFAVPEGTTFEQYLGLTLPEDEISEIPLSLKAMQGTMKEKEKTTGLTPEEQV